MRRNVNMKKGIILREGYFEDSRGRLIKLNKNEEVKVINVKGNFLVDFVYDEKLFTSDLNLVKIIN